jgi:hypothetical protein
MSSQYDDDQQDLEPNKKWGFGDFDLLLNPLWCTQVGIEEATSQGIDFSDIFLHSGGVHPFRPTRTEIERARDSTSTY